ncbi:hypothetical protein ANN_25151 [Periplaneta americana]|uniref:Uncharacterized protein n=1 Tax=Periplaneta americana TaxID=6978 RepID=A0ABQ8S0N2_PERAM|nr:hypothetical protein ANN_25151 [Periplaneta americana]
MSPSTESYPAFALIGLRENPGKNLNQVGYCGNRAGRFSLPRESHARLAEGRRRKARLELPWALGRDARRGKGKLRDASKVRGEEKQLRLSRESRGSLYVESRKRKQHVLTPEKLEVIKVRTELSPKKSLRHLAKGTNIPCRKPQFQVTQRLCALDVGLWRSSAHVSCVDIKGKVKTVSGGVPG